MNGYLNYLIESNVSLLVFLAVYTALFRKENDFHMKRLIILAGLFASVVFPFFHFNGAAGGIIPTIDEVIPTIWLPELTVGTAETTRQASPLLSVFELTGFVYAAGVLFFLAQFIIELYKLSRQVSNAGNTIKDQFIICQSVNDTPSFSFFNFIFIGNSATLTSAEKNQIIAHECVHARRLHSFDVLFVNVLKIFFWFNPLIRVYKNILVELHEFEADARSVENTAVNDYCNLLAKVALMSADLRLANYFTNSLTLKRIEMIRKIKMKIGGWKLAIAACLLPILFFVVACQEQVANEVQGIADNSSMAIDAPKHLVERVEQLQKEKPDSKFILIEFNETAQAKLESLEKEYGLPKSMDVYKGTSKDAEISGSSQAGVIVDANAIPDGRSYAILEYNKLAGMVNTRVQEGDVYTIVDESAVPVGGIEELYKFLGENLIYPESARTQGLEGKVFVEFIIEKDGAVTNAKVAKGVDPLLDKAALDVVSKFSKWTPGKHEGKTVRQKMVLPVNFKL